MLAYALEWREGLAFSAGLSTRGVPAIQTLGPGGRIEDWIEVGAPDARRLHKASLGGARVTLYTWRDPERLCRDLSRARVHRAEAVRVVGLEPGLLAELGPRLERRTRLAVLREGTRLEVEIAGVRLASVLRSRTLA